MVITNDPELARRVRLWGSYGEHRRFMQVGSVSLLQPLDHEVEGYHNHLDTLQAAILHAKLKHVDGWIARRREVAARYDALLAGSGVLTPYVPTGTDHVYRNYVIRVQNRDEIRHRLAEQGIVTNVLYTPPVHLQSAYSDCRMRGAELPVTEQVAGELLCLPFFAELTGEQIEYVAGSVREALR
jgi:dTDP-4-amino-4,6-dideoxygalactose transaminase